MTETGSFEAVKTREKLQRRGMISGNIIRYAYRPFDVRWLYWEAETKLLDRNRAEYRPHIIPGNVFLSAGERNRKEVFYQPQIVRPLADHHLVESNVALFPLQLNGGQPNLPKSLIGRLATLKLPTTTIFHHVAATLNAPAYYTENAGALRMDWPRVPLPGNAKILHASAALGATLATLLDPETPAPGISSGTLRVGLKTHGPAYQAGGKGLDGDGLNLTAGWGSIQNSGGGRIVMPGRGLATERAYTETERAALAQEGKVLGLSFDEVLALLGAKTFDIHLNGDAWWSNVPERVWDYTLGGYQVIKKWLSYREHDVLGRALKPEEAAYVSEMVRRIAAILLLGPTLNANYAASKAAAVEWKEEALANAT